MEISDVRRRVLETIERAKRHAADRRARADQANREFGAFLDQVATPLLRQVANVLKTQGYPFTVFTPSSSVRLTSDKHAEDFIELSLDTTGERPAIIGRSSRARGQRIIDAERPVAEGTVGDVDEETVLAFVLKELQPLVER